MQVKLKDLKPNPFRDFAVDPVDQEQVATLTKSIKANDFWGGVVCRQDADGIEVAAGWHRVKAAIAAGKVTAEIYVAPKGKMTDHDMIRIYATENTTHRGEQGSAIAGTIASAIKFIARAILTDNWDELAPPDGGAISDATKGQARRTLTSAGNGVGEPMIVQFLRDVPGINKKVVTQQIANLKTSGIYDRLIGEVQAELAAIEKVEREAADEAEAERKRAEEAAVRAAFERKVAEEKREQEREEARAAKAERDAEIAAEKEKAKKKALQEKARREFEAAARAEERRIEAEAKEKEKAKLAEERRKEAEAKAAEREKIAAKAKAEKEAADKAKAAAKEQERKLREEKRDFDFEGVAKHLKSAAHINQFRELVKAPGIAPYVTRDQHAALAEAIVKAAKEAKIDSTRFAGFMDIQILSLAVNLQKEKRRFTKKQEEEAEKRDAYRKAEKKLELFSASVRSCKSNLWQLLDLAKKGGMNPVQHGTFRTAIDGLIEVMEDCRKAGFTTWSAEEELTRAVHTKVNGKYHKLVAHLDNANEGERHNAADLLSKAARSKKVTVAKLLGLEW